VQKGVSVALVYPPTITGETDRYRHLYAAIEAFRLKHNKRAGDVSGKAHAFRLKLREVRQTVLDEMLHLRQLVGTPGWKPPKDELASDPVLDTLKAEGKAAHKTANLKELTGVDLDAVIGSKEIPPDPTEDFTGYTSFDEGSDLTITAPKIDIDTMRNDVSAYVYDDKGAAHFGDGIDHDFDINWHYTGQGRFALWAMSNHLESYYDWFNGANNEAIALVVYGPSAAWYLYDFEDDSFDYATHPTVPVGADAWNYCTVTRSGDNVSIEFFSDSNRTSSRDVITTAVANGRTYRYIYGLNSYDDPGTNAGDGGAVIQNLDLNEAAAFVPYPLSARGASGGLTVLSGGLASGGKA